MTFTTILTTMMTVLIVQTNQLQKHSLNTSLNILQLLELNNNNCDKLQNTKISISFLQPDDQFIQFARLDNMQNLKQRISEEIEKQIKVELKKVLKFYNNLKDNILEQYQLEEENLKQIIIQKTIGDFQKNFIEEIAQRPETLQESKLIEDVQFLEALQQTQNLIEQIFQNQDNNKFSKDFYLYDKQDKINIVKEIYKDQNTENMINKNWPQNSSSYDNFKNYLQDNYELQKNTEEDYVKFIDYHIIHPKSQLLIEQGEFLLLDQRYLNFEIFDFLFKDYNSNNIELYNILYELIIKFRIKNLDNKITLSEFLNFIDINISEQDQKFYYALKFFIYFKMNKNEQNYDVNFNYNIKPDSEPVKRLIEDDYDLRLLAVQINLQYKLGLRINEFENAVENKDKQELTEAIEDYFNKTSMDKNNEISQYLNQLTLTQSQDDLNRKDTIIKSVINFSVQNYINPSLEKIKQKEKYQKMIDQILLENQQIKNLDFLEQLLTQISTKENDFILYLNNMKKFFQNENFRLGVIDQTKDFKLTSDTQEYCKELQMDLTLMQSQYFSCSELQINGHRQFSDNYLLNFIKYMSFLRFFEFYNEENSYNIFFFVRLYKLIILNRIQYNDIQDNTVVQSFSDNLDTYVQQHKNQQELLQGQYQYYFSDINKIHSTAKILNLKNFLISENQDYIQTTNFPFSSFSDLDFLMQFQNDSKVNRSFNDLVEKIRQQVFNKPKFYALNQIYLILKSYQITQQQISSQEKYNQILPLTETINIYQYKNIDQNFLKTLRDISLFYFMEYLNALNQTENRNVIHRVFKKDIERLQFNEKLYLFSVQIFGILNNKTDFDNLVSKEFNNEILNENLFNVKIARKYQLFKQLQDYDQTLVKSLTAYEYFVLLIQNENYEQIKQENLLAVIEDHPLELFIVSDRQQKYGTQSFKDLANKWIENDVNYSENMFLFNYYIFIKYLTQKNILKIHQYINTYFHNKINGLEIDKEDQLLNSENLYFISQLIFTELFSQSQFETLSDLNRNELNMKTASLWLHFNQKDFNDLEKIPNENLKKSLQQFKQVIPTMTTKHAITHKHLNFLEETFRGIFEKRCRYEEFDFILNHCDYKQNFDILKQSVEFCSQENDSKVLNDYVYQMINSIRDSIQSRIFDKNLCEQEHYQLYDQIKQSTFHKLSSYQILHNLKRVFSIQNQVIYNKSFAQFLGALWQNFSLQEIQDMSKSKLVTALLVNYQHEEILKILSLDTILFAEFSADFDYNKLELHNQDIFSLMYQQLRYSSFLTKLFSQGDFSQKYNLEKYFEIYSFIAKFRIDNISGDVLDNNKINEFKVKFFDSQTYGLGQEIHLKSNAVQYVANIFFEFYVQEIMKNFDQKNHQNYKCQLVDLCLNLMGQQVDIATIVDIQETQQLLNINQEIKNNFDFLFKEIQKFLNYKIIDKNQICTSNEQEIMNNFTNFYEKINPNIKTENKATKFKFGQQEETLQIDKNSEFKKKSTLFI